MLEGGLEDMERSKEQNASNNIINKARKILTKYPLSPFISQSLEGSKIVPLFLRIIKLVSPLLPVALKQIKSILSN